MESVVGLPPVCSAHSALNHRRPQSYGGLTSSASEEFTETGATSSALDTPRDPLYSSVLHHVSQQGTSGGEAPGASSPSAESAKAFVVQHLNLNNGSSAVPPLASRPRTPIQSAATHISGRVSTAYQQQYQPQPQQSVVRAAPHPARTNAGSPAELRSTAYTHALTASTAELVAQHAVTVVTSEVRVPSPHKVSEYTVFPDTVHRDIVSSPISKSALYDCPPRAARSLAPPAPTPADSWDLTLQRLRSETLTRGGLAWELTHRSPLDLSFESTPVLATRSLGQESSPLLSGPAGGPRDPNLLVPNAVNVEHDDFTDCTGNSGAPRTLFRAGTPHKSTDHWSPISRGPGGAVAESQCHPHNASPSRLSIQRAPLSSESRSPLYRSFPQATVEVGSSTTTSLPRATTPTRSGGYDMAAAHHVTAPPTFRVGNGSIPVAIVRGPVPAPHAPLAAGSLVCSPVKGMTYAPYSVDARMALSQPSMFQESRGVHSRGGAAGSRTLSPTRHR